MATIHNNTRYTLAIQGNEFSRTVDRGTFIEVPNDVARAWLRKPTPAVFFSEGLIRVSGLEAVETIAPKTTPKTPKVKGSAAPAPPVHWKTMLRTVSGLDDLDALQDLHANEKRPRILTAIETRMAELNGG